MAGHSTYFESTPGGMMLTNAILLYQRDRNDRAPSDGAAFASLHPVEDAGGKPMIGAGTPLSRAHLRQWSAALAKADAPEILPGNVLVAHKDVLAWWVPEQVRTAYFLLSNAPKELKALASRTTVQVPYPAHVFIATRKALGVYALPVSERPTAETQLLASPILNVFSNGTLCWGNIARPKTMTVASMSEYERAVFDSWSTHPNPGQEHSVTGKGGLVQLWDDLAARKASRFPVKRLRPFNGGQGKNAPPTTLGALIAQAARS